MINNPVWLQQYPEGVPHTIDPHHYSSIVDLFEDCVKKYGDRPAFEKYGQANYFY